MKYGKLFLIVTAFGFLACAPAPQDIRFGEDACHFCLMTIVDKRHAAELVTSKGKVFKFDAIECMVQYLNENADDRYAFLLVSDYENPGILIDAVSASYLVSPAIPSPMGAYLSAFASHDRAQQMQREHNGHVYDWESLRQNLGR